MRSFSNFLSRFFGGFNPKDFRRGIEVELSIEEAESIFGKGVVHKNEDLGSFSIHYYIRKEGGKVKLFVKVK